MSQVWLDGHLMGLGADCSQSSELHQLSVSHLLRPISSSIHQGQTSVVSTSALPGQATGTVTS